MRKSAVLIVVLWATGGAYAASGFPSVSPGTEYRQLGAAVYSPNDAGWSLMQSTPQGFAFGRQFGDKDDSAIINTTVFAVEGIDKDSEFLDYIASQREAQDDKKRFKVVSVKNEQTSFKGTACLKYQTVSEDHKGRGITSKKFEYLKAYGYICRHPDNRTVAFQMEVSHRSKEATFPDALLSTGDSFFQTIQFNADGLK